MCGIAGVVRLEDEAAPPDDLLLRRMLGALAHRGPDAFGTYRDDTVGLAHARLSIIDLATGQQPLANEDGTLWIAFNGEIFNYLELRDELASRGHRFRTASDTEVIVHAWEEWGEEAMPRFNGQWAFALWDRRRRRLVLSRDRHGVRPLFVARAAGRLIFGSEVKALFVEPAVPRAVDPLGLDQVFTFWTTVAPRTPFDGVEEIPPGHTRIVELDRTRGRESTRPYWQPSYPRGGEGEPRSIDEAAVGLRDRLEQAVRLRMLRADVPVGCYLSGGIDSSVIAALGRRAKEGVFRTFSLRFADAEFDETRYQRLMAERLNAEHTEVVCSRADIARVFPEVVEHTERPVLRSAPAPMFLLSRLVRDARFKVVLTGEGSDEMLGGYDIFREAKVRAFWARDPDSSCRPQLLERLYPYLARSPAAARAMSRKFFAQGLDRPAAPGFTHGPRWSAASALKRLIAAPLRQEASRAEGDLLGDLPASFASWDVVSRAQYLEVRTLLSGYLLASQGDRMLMANSVEGRFPFLDPDVVAYADAMPSRFKLRVLDEKHVLKRAAGDLIPREILERPKQPYRAPDALSFVGAGAPDYVTEVLSRETLERAGLFEADPVVALVAKCRDRAASGQLSNADNMAFLGVLSTQLLWELFVRSRPLPAPVAPERIGTRAAPADRPRGD
jgi:asparagine synthase (glutamine-hydrolysing)